LIKATHHFPKGFLWGTATSSHQVEGSPAASDWAEWETGPGHILEGATSSQACGWWKGRWKDDFDLAAASGQNAHRLSVEWSRLEPEPDRWDSDALDQYEAMARGLLERGMMPMVSLHHFTHPKWFMESGGWLREDSAVRFEKLVEKVVHRLKNLVGLWVTINEPNVLAYTAHLAGVFPPGEQDLGRTIKVMASLTRAHAAAYRTIHRIQPGALVGMAHHVRGMRPRSPLNPLDRLVARIRSSAFNDTIPRALKDGHFRILGQRHHIPEAAGTQDFIGLNYYTEEAIQFDPAKPGELFSRGAFPPDADLSPTGFIANEPLGFWRALSWAHSFRLPIYVTENGTEDAYDGFRPRYLATHLRQLWRAANSNWQVKGYFHWTLVDNFEWERGWTQRFGLWELDPETQERRKRPSADFYAEVCRENGLSSEMVARYAPEVLHELFPQQGPGQLDGLTGT
jgi:beta-glucosidase